MDYLLDYGISEDTLDTIKKRSDNQVSLIESNETRVSEAIDYFESIGIRKEVIENMLLNYPDIFFKKIDEIKDTFSHYDTSNLVLIINNDISILERIF